MKAKEWLRRVQWSPHTMYLYKSMGATYLQHGNLRYKQVPPSERWTAELRNERGKWEKAK